MPEGHCPAISQVTAVDDQFGTHSVAGRACAPGYGITECLPRNTNGHDPLSRTLNRKLVYDTRH